MAASAIPFNGNGNNDWRASLIDENSAPTNSTEAVVSWSILAMGELTMSLPGECLLPNGFDYVLHGGPGGPPS